MPQVDIDGANSKVSSDKIQGQSGTTVTVPTGHVLTVTDAAGLTVNGVVPLTSVADNSVTLAKMAGGTDGQIITYDASGDPVAVGPGSDGQVLTSTGAGSPPAFESAAGGGQWVLLTSTLASGAASIDFTNITSTYNTYVMVISEMRPSTDGEGIRLRFGDSSGFDSGGSDYAQHQMRPTESSGSYSGSAESGATDINISHAVGNGTGEGFGGMVYIHQPQGSAIYPMVTFHCATFTASSHSSILIVGFGAGVRQAVITLDRVQLLCQNGNISGRVSLYGIKHT